MSVETHDDNQAARGAEQAAIGDNAIHVEEHYDTQPASQPEQPATDDTSSDAAAQAGAQRSSESDGSPFWKSRLDKVVWQKHEAERRAAAAEAQLQELMRQVQVQAPQQQVAQAATQASQMPQQPAQFSVEERAREIVAQHDFDRRCNELYAKGKKEIPDFEQALRTFSLLGGAPAHVFDVVSRLDNGHEVLAEIARQPELAAQLVDLPPLSAAAEIARIASKSSSRPRPALSRAPEPTTPTQAQSGARGDLSFEKMDMADIEKHARSLRTRR